MDDHLSAPRLGILTQGTVFACAVAEDYHGCHIHGLVITARCDAAQSKVPIFNYLPVVSLDDWIHRDGRLLLCDRIVRNILGQMRRALKTAGYAESVMRTQAPEAILDVLFPNTPGNRAAQKARADFAKIVAEHGEAVSASNSMPSENLATVIGNRHVGERDALIRELIQQRLSGYYFLPSISLKGPNLGYVVLLREVRHIPRELAASVAAGISEDEYQVACNGRPHFLHRLSFAKETFAMPVGLLKSPHVEHLMQVFSTLFSRIALPDPDPTYIENAWRRLPSVGETE
jgi:hypothetical protein